MRAGRDYRIELWRSRWAIGRATSFRLRSGSPAPSAECDRIAWRRPVLAELREEGDPLGKPVLVC